MESSTGRSFNETIHPPTPPPPPTHIASTGVLRKGSLAFILFFSSFGVLIFLSNFMVCVAYFKVKSIRTKTNKFVISTSISAIFIGIIFAPFFAVLDDVVQSISTDVIPVSSFLGSFLGFSLLFNIGALTYERHVAVFHSLKYNIIITHRHVNRALIVVWLIPFLLSTLPALFPYMIKDRMQLFTCFKVYQGFLSSLLTLILCAFFVVYFRVWRTSLLHLAFDRRQRLSISSSHLSQMKDLPSQLITGIFRRPAVTEMTTVDSNDVEMKSLLMQQTNGECGSVNRDTKTDEFAQDLTRRLSVLSYKSSTCSVTLNGEALDGVDIHHHHQPLQRQRNFSVRTESSQRKLSADWVPSVSRGQHRARKLSMPVKSCYNAENDRVRRPRIFSEGALQSPLGRRISFDISERDYNMRTSDSPSENGSPLSFHSCRSRVSFASCEPRGKQKQRSSLRQKKSNGSGQKQQIKGIIKKNSERTRRNNHAPTRCRTFSQERSRRPDIFTKSISFPNKRVFEKMTTDNKEIRTYLQESRRATLLHSPAISKTPSSGSSRYDSPYDSCSTSPNIQVRHQIHRTDDSFVIDEKKSSLKTKLHPKLSLTVQKPTFESETRIGESETRLGESETRTGESETRLGESETRTGESETRLGESETRIGESETRTLIEGSDTRSREFDTRTETIECTVSPFEPAKSPSSGGRSPIPASVRRALYRLKRINGDFSETGTSMNDTTDGADAGRRSLHCSSVVSSRLTKSRNSVIVQAKEFFKEIKHTRVIALIVFINAFCWTPVIFMNFADATGHSSLVTPNLIFSSHVLFLLNSLVMPYIYAFCKHDFRNVFRKFLCWRRKASNRL